MGKRLEDLTGKKFNMATVIRCYSKEKNSGATAGFCECVCDCGNEFTARSYELKVGKVKSCGCLRVTNLRKISLERTKRIREGKKHE